MALAFIGYSIGILQNSVTICSSDKIPIAEIDEYQRKCYLRRLFHLGRNFVRELEFRSKFLQRFCSHLLLLFTKKKLKFFNKDKSSSELFKKFYYKKQMAVELFRRFCSHLLLLFTKKKLKFFKKDKSSSELFNKFYYKKQMAVELFRNYIEEFLLQNQMAS